MLKKILTVLFLSFVLVGCTNNKQGSNDTNNSNNTTNNSVDSSSSESSKQDSSFNSEIIEEYYEGVHGSKGVLKNELHKLISKRNKTSYGDLWTTYKKSDVRSDGKIMDIYSNATNYIPGSDQDRGSHPTEGSTYNREHTIPRSWWGGSKENQGSDPFIVFPSDSKVNEMRANYPFGEVSVSSYESENGYSKLGSSKFSIGPSKVFEPADEWKGDMARAYFYALTCYNTTEWTQKGGDVCFSTSGNYGLTDYASKLFLKWHKQDPVSDWERQRNNIIFGINNNRNPYIDHPEFVESIWGDVTF